MTRLIIISVHWGLVIGTSSVIETPLCNSLSERTPYRNVLLIGKNCSDNKYAKCLCNVLFIGTILSSDTEYVLLIRTKPYSLSEQFDPIRSTASHTPYQNKTILLIGTNGWLYSLSEQNRTPYRNNLF